MIFIQKYKPQKLEEIPQENIIKLKKLLSIKKKGIFVYGPTGCGKSAAIEIILKDYDVVEIDPSNYMGREEIENRLIKSCKENSLFGKQKLFLIAIIMKRKKFSFSNFLLKTSFLEKIFLHLICQRSLWKKKKENYIMKYVQHLKIYLQRKNLMLILMPAMS